MEQSSPTRRNFLWAGGGVVLATAVGGVLTLTGGGRDASHTKAGKAGKGDRAGAAVENTGSMSSTASPHTAWSLPVGGIVRALRYQDGRVYVVTIPGGLLAADAATGRVLWRESIWTTAREGDFAVDNGVLYVCGALTEGGEAELLALDAASGRRLWTYAAPSTAVLGGAYGVLDGAVLVIVYNHVTSRREVWSVDTRTRHVRWRAHCPDDNTTLYVPPTGTLVYDLDPNGANIQALDTARHGAVAWAGAGSAGDPMSAASSCLATGLVGGKVLTTDGQGSIAALDPATGKVAWKVPATSGAAGAFGASTVSLFADGGDVYYVWDGRHLTARQAGAAGAQLWTASVKTGGFALNTQVLVDPDSDTLFVTGAALYAADLRTGGCRWQYSGTGPIPVSFDTPMAAGGGHCYLAADRSTVVALTSSA
ncbi:PQQ-binding-like beta-propeller repeat protein [Streptacidiphilus jiangxiensis]|uniref:PQQ-like domain-containing protein n=1 Tax=Streptacidiphilus jiangxiensis TaxID=235985 RepID=A0A1H7MVK8_STRJI|nr:PQQ-binding-like beta-propeller repeat protein [Streptacidiphilus jiangxiensis]SEL15332.1 PQQ-like domain-containing protein [Streptacidiphilus jiangxiensis]